MSKTRERVMSTLLLMAIVGYGLWAIASISPTPTPQTLQVLNYDL